MRDDEASMDFREASEGIEIEDAMDIHVGSANEVLDLSDTFDSFFARLTKEWPIEMHSCGSVHILKHSAGYKCLLTRLLLPSLWPHTVCSASFRSNFLHSRAGRTFRSRIDGLAS